MNSVYISPLPKELKCEVFLSQNLKWRFSHSSCFKLSACFLLISSFFWGRPESQEDLIFTGGENTQTSKTQNHKANKPTKPHHPPQKSRRSRNAWVLLRMEVFSSRISTVRLNSVSLDLKATNKRKSKTSTKTSNPKTKERKPGKFNIQESLYFCMTQAQLSLGNLNLISI